MEHIQRKVILIWFSNIYFAEIPNNERNVVHKSKKLIHFASSRLSHKV